MSERSHLRSEEAAATALGGLLHDARGATTERTADAELERLLRNVDSSRADTARSAWRKWTLVAAAALAVLGLAGTFEWQRRDGAPLTFAANGVPAHEHAAIAAESGRVVDVVFSDGSVFNVEPAARLRVDSSSSTGARMTLVEGRTIAHVVHRPKTSWSVTAGPFLVQVTGTRFGASWDAKNDRLSVELYEGSVQVAGGGFAQPIAVRAGQRLEAGRGPDNWLLTSLDGPAGSVAGASPAPAHAPASPSASEEAAAPAPEPPAPAGSGAASRSASTLDWPERIGRADFEGIVREANELGIERCLSSCAPSDLRMLADAARYLGRYALAERSLLALRKRSPSDAASAAFLLGRLEESRDPQKALAWYERSLEEAPAGPYAAEAAAGKMRMQRSDRR